MKKMKKILAMVLAMAMVLGMSLTTFAADTPAKVTNAVKVDNTVVYKTVKEGDVEETVVDTDKSANLSMMQIIVEDTTTETGWNFANDQVALAYRTAFAPKKDDGNGNQVADMENAPTAQAVLWSLIKLATPEAEVPTNTQIATAGQIEEALDGVNLVAGSYTFSVDGTAQQAPVDKAGVYMIVATQDGYNYNRMAAYVSFAKYENGVPVGTQLESAVINAKKNPTGADKSSDERDKVTYVGKVVTYTITTEIPYITDAAGNNVKFEVTDTITGAEYVLDADGKVAVTVKVGDDTVPGYVGELQGTNSFKVDLKNLATDRNNANKVLTISYQAKVTGLHVNNKATFGDGKNTWNAEDDLYTGSITMTKTDESNTGLNGAEFVVYYVENNARQYAVLNSANEVTGWTPYLNQDEIDAAEEAGVDVENAVMASHATTAAVTVAENKTVNGTVTVKGLDDSKTYFFKEVVAPTGYSINETDSTAQWAIEGQDGYAAEDRKGSASMTDTRLNALPSTGGIGTTIFTIGGCAIMVVAAGLFFATRKKSTK